MASETISNAYPALFPQENVIVFLYSYSEYSIVAEKMKQNITKKLRRAGRGAFFYYISGLWIKTN